MKLVDLDMSLKNFDGAELRTLNEKKEEIALTIRQALLNLVGSAKPEEGNGAQSIKFYKLGVALASKDGDMGVSVEDMSLLKKAIEQNAPGYYVVVIGQLLNYLDHLGEAKEPTPK